MEVQSSSVTDNRIQTKGESGQQTGSEPPHGSSKGFMSFFCFVCHNQINVHTFDKSRKKEGRRRRGRE